MASSSTSSTLVNVAEDAELRLVRLLADASASSGGSMDVSSFVAECESCIVRADAAALIRIIVGHAMPAFFVLETENSISAVSLLAALLDRVSSEEEGATLATALANSIVETPVMGDEQEMHLRRVTLLSSLYNLRSNGREKCALLGRMVVLATKHVPSLLEPGQTLGNLLLEDGLVKKPALVDLMEGWNVPVADRRDMLRAAANGMVHNTQRKQQFILLLVETYENGTQVDAAGLEVTKEAAIGAIRDPISLFTQQRSMLEMPAVQALGANADTKILHGLLGVFQEGKLEDYEAFIKNNGGEAAVLQPYGLDSQACVRHMRILSLVSLAAEQEEIPYATVAQTLKLPSEDEVESWVIAAVSSGLLQAKMDQLQQTVIVERSVVRRFDIEQWKALERRLDAWKENVRSVVEGFKKQNQLKAATN